MFRSDFIRANFASVSEHTSCQKHKFHLEKAASTLPSVTTIVVVDLFGGPHSALGLEKPLLGPLMNLSSLNNSSQIRGRKRGEASVKKGKITPYNKENFQFLRKC